MSDKPLLVTGYEDDHKVIVCRVGCEPVVEVLDAGQPTITLESMQAVVDGYIERVMLEDHQPRTDGTCTVELYCNEEGRIQGLRPNRLVISPHQGEVLIHGDFLICAGDPTEGETIGLLDEQVDEWMVIVASWRTFEVYGGRN